jgi:predicted GNAT family N-acyltransferase
MTTPFSIRILAWHEAMPLAQPVRLKVFVEEQGVPVGLEWDQWDEASDHAIAFDAQGDAIGTARLLPDGRIGRMAVLREWRNHGAGAALLEAMLERARQRGMIRVSLNAQTQAAGFYRRFGFVESGKVFMEADIPHVTMQRTLSPATIRSGS